MPTVLVPVGLSLGPSYRYVTPPDPKPEYWEVRLGADSEELNAAEFLAWGATFRDPERHARLEINRATLRDDLTAAGGDPAEVDRVINRLLERRLLLEYDTEGDLEPVFSRLTLYPLAEGMGNTPDEPDRRHIGHNGQSLVKVTGLIYGLWAASSLDSSLWAACAGMAADNRADIEAGMDLEPVSAMDAAREIAEAVPMLLSSGCAFLDPVG